MTATYRAKSAWTRCWHGWLNLQHAGGFTLALDCSIRLAGVTAVYGPSGSGKTTLLHCLAGLERPGAGSLLQIAGDTWCNDDRVVPPWQRAVGTVFQDARLFPHLTVRGNLEYARRRHHQLGRSAAYP